MSLAMSKEERQAFLAETRIGVVSVAEPGRGPLTVPVWYAYEPGSLVRFVTGGSSRKAKLLRSAGRASLLVQTETPPYKYVSVEGRLAIGEPDYERDVRAIAVRYLGKQMGEAYLQTMGAAGESSPNILVELRPEHWLSVDYAKL